MKQLYVYILECSDKSYYTGVTNNPEKRLQEHNRGIITTSYTYTRRPVKIMYVESFTNFNLAIEWEKRIKKWSRKKKEALIDGNWEKLKKFSECMNDSHFKNQKK